MSNTGGASGIGLATTKRLLATGITRIVLVDLKFPNVDHLIASLAETSPDAQVIHVEADVSKEEDVENAVQATITRFGRVDVAFLAAGIGGRPMTLESTETEALDKVLGVNLRGVWLCERAIVRQMLLQEERPVTYIFLGHKVEYETKL